MVGYSPQGRKESDTTERLHFTSLHFTSLQETPGVTVKFGLGVQNEAGQRLIEFCQENTLVIANILFQQHKRRLYTWTSPMVNIEIRLIIFFAVKDGEALYSQQKQDWELTVAQIMNSLLPNSNLNWIKFGKTTRPFRYDLNQIPNDYMVEVRNRFKGLDLIDRVPDELWTRDLWHCTGFRDQDHLQGKKKKIQKGKMVNWEGLTKAVNRRESESEVSQSCPTLRDPTDCSLPGFSVHGIFQGRVLEWVAVSFSKGSSWHQGSNPGLLQTLYALSHQGRHQGRRTV